MPEEYFAALAFGGDIWEDVKCFLQPRRPDTWEHVQAVAEVTTRLAVRFSVPPDEAETAALCHDLAAVVPSEALIAVAEAWGALLLPADRLIPQTLHGPIAAAVVERRLSNASPGLINAIRYHTTLRAGASDMEKVVFVADKIAYDPTTSRTEYLTAVEKAAHQSLDAAAFTYIDFVVTHQAELKWRLHPRLLAAHRELAGGLR